MKMRAMKASAGLCLVVAVAGAAAVGCGKGEGSGAAAGGIQPQVMADAIYSVIAADRAVYTREVVNRLTNDNAIKATEHFKDEKTLPLPAQMLRMGSEQSQKTNPSFTYALLSMDPINKQNAPKTEAEKTGLKFVADNPGKNYYGDEKLGDKSYFTAVYADKATVEACAKCHNEHPDSARKDWKVGDTMGALVIRIPKG